MPTAFHSARPKRSQWYYVSTVGLSKCKKLHSIQHSQRGPKDWPSRQHANWDKWDKHFGVLFYTLALPLHFRQYAFLWDSAGLSLPACLHLYMYLTQVGEDGKRGANCTFTFTRHWITFFGTRVQNWYDTCVCLSLSKRKRVIIICLCVWVRDVMISESSHPHFRFPKLETWDLCWNRLLVWVTLLV